VYAVRPELMRADAEVMRPRGLAVSMGAVALVAAGLSYFASTRPDGLEFVAGEFSFLGRSAPLWKSSPMAGYVMPGMTNEGLAGVLAGVAGVIVVGVGLYALLKSARSRRSDVR
jgi:hypothetical protein